MTHEAYSIKEGRRAWSHGAFRCSACGHIAKLYTYHCGSCWAVCESCSHQRMPYAVRQPGNTGSSQRLFHFVDIWQS